MELPAICFRKGQNEDGKEKEDAMTEVRLTDEKTICEEYKLLKMQQEKYETIKYCEITKIS